MKYLKKTAVLGAVAALSVTSLAFSAPSQAVSSAPPTANQLKITKVGTDAMGSDTFANRNREFVTFKNVSGGPIDVADILIEDNWAHTRTLNNVAHSCNTYKITDLPDNGTIVIADDESVTVFNGVRAGGNYKTGAEYRLYANSDTDCGYQGQFYNNDADTAWVTKADGTPISKRSWDWNGGYHVVGSLNIS